MTPEGKDFDNRDNGYCLVMIGGGLDMLGGRNVRFLLVLFVLFLLLMDFYLNLFFRRNIVVRYHYHYCCSCDSSTMTVTMMTTVAIASPLIPRLPNE